MTAKQKQAEQAGIEAIIFLQSLGGIAEAKERARAGWRGMTKQEQEQTMRVFERMKRGSN